MDTFQCLLLFVLCCLLFGPVPSHQDCGSMIPRCATCESTGDKQVPYLCIACEQGYYLDDFRTKCVDCNDFNAHCSACGVTDYKEQPVVCTSCLDRNYMAHNQSACQALISRLDVERVLIHDRVALFRFKTLPNFSSTGIYGVHYKMLSDENINPKGSCLGNKWRTEKVNHFPSASRLFYFLYNLKPNTQYAMYVDTCGDAALATRGAISKVMYFTASSTIDGRRKGRG